MRHVLRQKPASGAVFAFRGRKGDRIKLLYWEFAPVRRRRQTVRGTV